MQPFGIDQSPASRLQNTINRQYREQGLDHEMHKDSRIVVIGAGVFGLSTAVELAHKGYKNIVIVDRHVPPVCHLYE
jgi:heterodisulfide reductase subunit A-like polyferredoxin